MEVSNIINVIDAPCGAGKTKWAIKYINDNPEVKIVYVTPYRSEIDRIREECGRYRIKEPEYYIRTEDGGTQSSTKIESFNDLLSKGESVAVTHATFLNATEETISNIRSNDYILILDEVLDVLASFNDIASTKIKNNDITELIRNGYLTIDKDNSNKMLWNNTRQVSDWVYSEIEKYIKLGTLSYVDNKDLLVVFSPEIFTAFKESYLLTYMFNGTLLPAYFRKYDIEYSLCGLYKNDGALDIGEYTPEAEKDFIRQIRPLITILDNVPEYGGKSALSMNWYDNATKDRIKFIANACHTALVRVSRAKAADIMLAYPKSKDSVFKHKGMVRSRSITGMEKKILSEEELDKLEKSLLCYVPLNARATNMYSDRWALAYCVNVFINPTFKHFLTDDPNNSITIDEDRYALSYMFQWVFRSRIRKGEPIVLYIPSTRMKGIFKDWLESA